MLTLLLQSTPVDRDFLSQRSSRVFKGPTEKTLKVLKAQVPLFHPCRSVAPQGQQQQQQLRSHHDDEFQTRSPNQDFPRHLCQDPCILLNHHGSHCNAPAGKSNPPHCFHFPQNLSGQHEPLHQKDAVCCPRPSRHPGYRNRKGEMGFK